MLDKTNKRGAVFFRMFKSIYGKIRVPFDFRGEVTMKGQRGENFGIIWISYILRIMASLSIFLSALLSNTFSIHL